MRKNLQRQNIDVDSEYIRDTWHPVYRRHFLRQALTRAYDCRKGYYMYHQQLQGMDSEVSKLYYKTLKLTQKESKAPSSSILREEWPKLRYSISFSKASGFSYIFISYFNAFFNTLNF